MTGTKPPFVASDECMVIVLGGELDEYECGHIAATLYAHDFYGEVKVPTDAFLGGRGTCSQCMLDAVLKVSMRCAACGRIIFPDEAVVLYPDSKRFSRDWRKLANFDPPRVIACMRPDCCESPGYFGGHWTRKGFKPAFDGKTQAEYAIATGKAVLTQHGTHGAK